MMLHMLAIVKHPTSTIRWPSPYLPQKGTAVHPPDESRGLSRSFSVTDYNAGLYILQYQG